MADSCACRNGDSGQNSCILEEGDNDYSSICADGYYPSACVKSYDEEMEELTDITESGSIAITASMIKSSSGCRCAVIGIRWPVVGTYFAYWFEGRRCPVAVQISDASRTSAIGALAVSAMALVALFI